LRGFHRAGWQEEASVLTNSRREHGIKPSIRLMQAQGECRKI
jgi:hypothetical protein